MENQILSYASEMEYDGSGNLIYLGLAVPGTGVADTFWQIRKLTYDGSGNLLSVLWANSSRTFSNVWNNRAGYTYG